MLVDKELPQVQAGLIARWRAMPRSLVLAVLCTALALSVDVWLTLLAAISGLIVFRSFRGIEQFGKARAEAYDVPQIRRRLVETVQTAPLISRVRGDETPVNESGGPLGRLMEAGKMLDLKRSRSVPILTAASAIVISLMVVALGGSMLVETTPITLPAAMVLSLSLIGAVVGAVRVLRFFNQKSDFVDACENVCHFIDRGTDAKVSERMGLGGRQHAIGMSGVTLYDGGGRILLNEISLKLEPSSVVAFLGTDPTAVNSLAELLLGFGNPRSGKVTVGEVPMSELHERWLSRNVLWIGRSGPVWSGTITENLGFGTAIPDNGQISEATRRVGVYDRLQTLPDGFATLISADDNRLDEQTRYGIGISRAWIRRPAVIVVQEPPLAAGTLTDDQGMDALCELAKMGSLVIVLPQRLRSLRMADRVILLNGANLAGEGKHEELLATSDLYRHLNYVLFNPYRHMTPSGA
jgi:ABC-type multidrug transport system fused ATPase/permease subunit